MVGQRAATAAQPERDSVLNLLDVVAGFFLLITGAYPRPLFDFLLGLNRRLYRVVTHVAFMSDEYPPFRLDMRGRIDSDAAWPSTSYVAKLAK